MRAVWCWPESRGARYPFVTQLLTTNGIDVVFAKSGSERELEDLVSDADFLVVRRLPRISERIIKAGRRLRLIQRVGGECGNIDIDAAAKAGILVATMPIATDITVAEHTLALMLALARRIFQAHRSVVNCEYERLGLKPIRTTENLMVADWVNLSGPVALYGKTLGLIGLGVIGKETARRARCFGMRILYYRRRRLTNDEEKELGVQYSRLHDLLRESDFVSLHVPHTAETENMIGKRELSLMKPTAYLVNTARGAVVDEDALYEALSKKTIAGAGLDVFREEPLPKSSPLIKLDNVILTPHTAARSSLEKAQIQWVVDNVVKCAKGEMPDHVVKAKNLNAVRS